MKRKIANVSGFVFVAYVFAGCRSVDSHAATHLTLREIASPAPSGSISPRVISMLDSSLMLTWLEPENDRNAALRYSLWRNNSWSAPATIATGQPFSRHPSESPGVVALSEKNLIAYWSQKPTQEEVPTQEVDVYFALSTDRGVHWTSPTLANHAGTGEESSYPSAAAVDANHAALIWLDGSHWKKERRVTLMSRTVQSDGSATEATVLDPDTCTCCPTSLVETRSGLLAAYRGHTPENIRDISLLQNVQGRWSQPRIVHPDHWHFAGCPVNGPHLDVDEATTALIWLSAPQGEPTVMAAFSRDGGSQFESPIRIDEGNAIGKPQTVALPGHSALVFWLENQSGTTRLLGRLVRDNGTLEAPFGVTRGVGLGYPHAIRVGKDVFITWADQKAASQIDVATLQP